MSRGRVGVHGPLMHRIGEALVLQHLPNTLAAVDLRAITDRAC